MKPKKPTSREIWAARNNLTNSFRPSFMEAWGKSNITRIRKESIQTLRAAQAHNLY